jgi:hypothetical protein
MFLTDIAETIETATIKEIKGATGINRIWNSSSCNSTIR